MITERERVEVRTSWPKPSLVYRLLVELEAAVQYAPDRTVAESAVPIVVNR